MPRDPVDVAARLILFGAIGAGALILVYLLWRVDLAALSVKQGLVFIVGPIALIVASLAILRFGRNLRLTLVTTGLAVLVAVYAVEAYLQLAPPPKLPSIKEYAEAHGLPYDPRTRREVEGDMRQEYGEVYPTGIGSQITVVGPDGVRYSPLELDGKELLPMAGVARAPLLLCKRRGPWVWYRSDEQGFRNPPGLWRAGSVDIFVTGSSFTHGSCVPDGELMVDYIRRRFPKTINASLPAVGMEDMLAVTREYGSVVRPPVVLWFLNTNSLSKLFYPFLSTPILDAYLEGDDPRPQRLYERKPEIDPVLRAFYLAKAAAGETRQAVVGRLPFSWTDMLLLRRLRLRLGIDVGGSHFDYGPFERIIDKAKEEVDSWGGRFVVVFIPVHTQFVDVARLADYQEDIRRRYLAMFEAKGIPVIDTTPVFHRHGDPLSLYVPHDPHYTPEGNRLVGEFVTDALGRLMQPKANR